MMDMSMGMGLLPQQQMKASPALIALNNMLVLSTIELQQLVQNELEENPALEQMESDESLCSRCGRPLSGATCIYCLPPRRRRSARRSSAIYTSACPRTSTRSPTT